ncbi:MAG: 30S ribosomal protein S3 [Betaproteobacteria bacterium]|nr:30S ribosomal protein S3 [Betaproteobacteria bacterium]
MGQKIHPIGFRLAVTRNWSSRWFANSKNFPVMLNEDIKVREYLKKKLAHASVGRVVIERPAKNARITIYSARPGVVIGKKGEDIEHLKADLQKILGGQVHVNIEEIRKPETDAQLIADSIAQQLEKRIMFRRAMKRAMQNAMRLGAQGIKIMSSGRLNGAEIARREWYREGRVPLHTLRADIDYGTSEAKTTYGIIGVKVWVFKGEMTAKHEVVAPAVQDAAADEQRRVSRRAPPPAGAATEAAADTAKPAAVVKRTARKPAAAKPEAAPVVESGKASATPAKEKAAAAKPPVKRVRKPAAPKPDAAAAKDAKE